MSRLALPAIAVLLAVMLAPPALAGSITSISSRDWAQDQQVPFRWRDDAVPPDWMKAALRGAAADSTRSRGARAAVVFHKAGASSWVAYSAHLPTAAALAYASRSAPDSYKVWLRVHGHAFDWGVLRWCQFFDNPPNGCFDAQTVGLHEFGHVQGLGHSPDGPADTVMYPTSLTKPKAGYNAPDFGPCDVAAMQIRYEALSPATPISSCLSLATDLSLATSATTVSASGSVTLTARLAIGAGVAYPRLASDPLSSRSVVLQRRAAGTTSWAVHGPMPDATTAGTYRLTLVPGATYEWRAVFASPASEGLKASSSSVVKVTVQGTDGSCGISYCRV